MDGPENALNLFTKDKPFKRKPNSDKSKQLTLIPPQA